MLCPGASLLPAVGFGHIPNLQSLGTHNRMGLADRDGAYCAVARRYASVRIDKLGVAAWIDYSLGDKQ